MGWAEDTGVYKRFLEWKEAVNLSWPAHETLNTKVSKVTTTCAGWTRKQGTM